MSYPVASSVRLLTRNVVVVSSLVGSTPTADPVAPTRVRACAQNFEHLTQAATGATSGDWLVKFCKPSVPRCARVDQAWSKVAVQLAASREALGLPRINVAAVDTSDSVRQRRQRR
eukprot:6182722-Pleurochrysis_carterae.AAC.3